MPHYYLRIEAVNFAYSVYDTNDISTIRGGSSLILDAFKTLEELEGKQEKSAFKIISTAASEAILRFEADEPALTADRYLKMVQQKSGNFATLVCAVFQIPDKAPPPFQTCLEKLRAACRRQQYRQWSFVLPQLDQQPPEKDLNEASNIDGIRPAIQKEGEKTLSYSVRFRRDEGKRLRQKIYETILGEKGLSDLFPNYESGEEPAAFADDLNDLAKHQDKGRLNGKIAFIYIDGNRFGTIRDHLFEKNALLEKGEEDLKAFQHFVQNTMRRAAMKAIITEIKKEIRTEKGNIRLETLLWGGDEVELIVPAWLGWKVLKIFFEETRKFQNYAPHSDLSLPLTHAAGVMFCHCKLPILQVRKYAHELCELAKKDIPKKVNEIDNSANRFAFLNMSAFDLIKGDVEDFVKTYHASSDLQDVVMQAQAMEPFETYLRDIKTDFPRNKLFDITTALKEGARENAEKILEQVYHIVGAERTERIKRAVEHLVGCRWQRWFVIADLIDYVGEEA